MSSSSSSSESSSSSQDGEEVGGGGGGGGGGDFEGPSSSRRRSGNGVWPEPFVEALAFQVAIDASRSIDRLAAATALASVFQVGLLLFFCSSFLIFLFPSSPTQWWN